MENNRIRFQAANSASQSQLDINTDLDNDDEDKLVIVEDPKEELDCKAVIENKNCESPKFSSTVEEHKFRGHKKKILEAYCRVDPLADGHKTISVNSELSFKRGSDEKVVSSEKIGSSDGRVAQASNPSTAPDSNDKAEQKACDSTRNEDEDDLAKKGETVPMFNLRSCIDLIIDSRLIRDKLNNVDDVLNEEYNIKVRLSGYGEGNTVRAMAKSRSDCNMLRTALHSQDAEDLDSMNKLMVAPKPESPGISTSSNTAYPSPRQTVSYDKVVSQSTLGSTFDNRKPLSPSFSHESSSSHQGTESPLHQIAALASLLPKQPVSVKTSESFGADSKLPMLKQDPLGISRPLQRMDAMANSGLDSSYEGHRPRSWSGSAQSGRPSPGTRQEQSPVANYASNSYSVHPPKLSPSPGQEHTWTATTTASAYSQHAYNQFVPKPGSSVNLRPGYPPSGSYGFSSPQPHSPIWNTSPRASPGPRPSSVPTTDQHSKSQPLLQISNIRSQDPAKLAQAQSQSRGMSPLMIGSYPPQTSRFPPPYKDIPTHRDPQTFMSHTAHPSSQQLPGKSIREVVSSDGRDYSSSSGHQGPTPTISTASSGPPKLLYIPDTDHMTRAGPMLQGMSYVRSGTSSGGGIVATGPSQKWSPNTLQPQVVSSVQPPIVGSVKTQLGMDMISGEAPLDLTLKAKPLTSIPVPSIPKAVEKIPTPVGVHDDTPLDLTVKRPGDIMASRPSPLPHHSPRSIEGNLAPPEYVSRVGYNTDRASPSMRYASGRPQPQQTQSTMKHYPGQGPCQPYVQQQQQIVQFPGQTQLPPQPKSQTITRFPPPSRSPHASPMYDSSYLAQYKDPKYRSYGTPTNTYLDVKQNRSPGTSSSNYMIDPESGTEKSQLYMQMRHQVSPNLQQQQQQVPIPTPILHQNPQGPPSEASPTSIPPLPQQLQQQGKAQAKATSTAQLLGNHPLHDILYLKCNVCNSTHGSLHSFRKHFYKAHGYGPTNEHVTVRSISATRESASKTEKALDELERPVIAEQVQGQILSASLPQMSPGTHASPESFASEEGYDMVHMQVQRPCTGGEMQHKMAPLSEANPVQSSEAKSPNSKTVEGGQSTMRCLQCGQDFPTRDWGVFRRHVRAHDQPQLRCSLCRQAFTTAKELQDHNKTYHSEQMWACRVCGVGFVNSGALGKHMKLVHQMEEQSDCELKCQLCPSVFTDVQLLLNHLQEHKDRPEFSSQQAESLISWSAVRRASPDSTNDVDQKLMAEQSGETGPHLEQLKRESETAEDSAEKTARPTLTSSERPIVASPYHIGIQGKDLMAIIRDKVEQEAIKHLKENSDVSSAAPTHHQASDQDVQGSPKEPVLSLPQQDMPFAVRPEPKGASPFTVKLPAPESNKDGVSDGGKLKPVPFKTVRDALNMLVERAVVDGCDVAEESFMCRESKDQSKEVGYSKQIPSPPESKPSVDVAGMQGSERQDFTQISANANKDSGGNTTGNSEQNDPRMKYTAGTLRPGQSEIKPDVKPAVEENTNLEKGEEQEKRSSPFKPAAFADKVDIEKGPSDSQKREHPDANDPTGAEEESSPNKKSRMESTSS